MDLAEIVGPAGRVVAVDRSRRFLDHLLATARHRGLANVTALELDLDGDALPALSADIAWSRWVFSFVRRRRELLQRVRETLKPGGALVLLEYLDYRSWRYAPRSPEIEAFVQLVMESWRAGGGEPDVALELHAWLADEGFEVRSFDPILHAVPASDFIWQWAKAFLATGPERLVELGSLSRSEADAIAASFARIEANPRALLLTPAVAEIIAVRR